LGFVSRSLSAAPWARHLAPAFYFGRQAGDARLIILFLVLGECTPCWVRFRGGAGRHDAGSGGFYVMPARLRPRFRLSGGLDDWLNEVASLAYAVADGGDIFGRVVAAGGASATRRGLGFLGEFTALHWVGIRLQRCNHAPDHLSVGLMLHLWW